MRPHPNPKPSNFMHEKSHLRALIQLPDGAFQYIIYVLFYREESIMSKVALAKINDISHTEWLKMRKHGIGGSDAAAVCGLSRWRGPLDGYRDKTSDKIEEKETPAIHWGNVMEPVLRAEFAKRSGLVVEEVPFLFNCREFPFMIANVDGIARETDGSVSLIEIKTANSLAVKDWDNGLPQEYYIQVQHYMSVLDLAKSYIVVLIGGNDFRIEEIPRDDETIQTIINLEAAFWRENILTLTPPAPDATSGDALNGLYPTSNGTSVILGREADDIISDLESCKQMEDQLKAARAESENALKAMLGEAECAKTPGGYSVRWKSSTTSRLDTTKLKADHPDLVAQYTKTTNYRRFSISAPKGDK